MEAYIIRAERDCYKPSEAVENTCTVGELIGFLSELPEDAKIILSHDGGYTYGWLDYERVVMQDPIETDEENEEGPIEIGC